jgi:Rieske 2Fe-2S family protein
LPRALHLDPDIYRLELDRIWRPAWLFAAHSAEVREAGQRVVFNVGDDSVLILRGDDGEVRAFHNFCRHRGTRLVDATMAGATMAGAETANGLVRCPYHQWAYRLDGSLAACGGMDRFEGLDPSQYGLLPVECAEVGGLIFVRLDPSSSSDLGHISELTEPLAPQGLARARVAYSETYIVEAGWKVVWENNRECWHCHLGHPEYIKSHYDTSNTDLPGVAERIAERTSVMLEALGGLPSGDIYEGGGLALFPPPGRSRSVNRTPLVEGFATESLDGSPLAPLMGEYQSYDVGVLRLRALPNFWCHASADHAVSTRLAPAGLERTEIVVTWLVADDALEGRDYHLDRLLTVWGRTSEQDWALCERNQLGIRSPAYLPGPLSTRHEESVGAFHDWYRSAIGDTGSHPQSPGPHPQSPGPHPQSPGPHPQSPGSHPQSPGP